MAIKEQKVYRGFIRSIVARTNNDGSQRSFVDGHGKTKFPHDVTVEYMNQKQETLEANSTFTQPKWKLNVECDIKRTEYDDGNIKLAFPSPKPANTGPGNTGQNRKSSSNDSLMINRSSTMSLRIGLKYIQANRTALLTEHNLSPEFDGAGKKQLLVDAKAIAYHTYSWILAGDNDEHKWQRYNAVECTYDAIDSLKIESKEALYKMFDYFRSLLPLNPKNAPAEQPESKAPAQPVQGGVGTSHHSAPPPQPKAEAPQGDPPSDSGPSSPFPSPSEVG